MQKKEDFKIELPHGVKQDIIIDLLVQNLAYSKTLANILIEETAQKSYRDSQEILNEFQNSVKQMKYEILAFIASKYGR